MLNRQCFHGVVDSHERLANCKSNALTSVKAVVKFSLPAVQYSVSLMLVCFSFEW